MRHAENNAARRNDIQKPIVLSSTKNHSSVSEDVAPTLTADMEKTKYVPITVTEKRFFQWYEDDKSVTIRHDSGSYGGKRSVSYTDTCGSLCYGDYKGVGNQYASQGKLIVEVIDESI